MGHRQRNIEKKIEQKLVNLSKSQTPDAWPELQARVQAEKASGRSGLVPGVPESNSTFYSTLQRSGKTMKRKYIWLTALSAAAIFVLIIASLLIQQLLPDPAVARLEPGKSLKFRDGSIFVNTISRVDQRIGMPPDAENQDLTLADLPALFGRAPIPELPDGFQLESATFSAMIFRNNTVFLMNGISFSTDAQDPKAARVVFDLNDQGELPLSDCRFGNEQASTLGGVEMMIGVEVVEGEDGTFEMYTAQFVTNNIGYRIRATNVTGDDFLSILAAVVKG